MTPSDVIEGEDLCLAIDCDPSVADLEECESISLSSLNRLDVLDRACNEMRYIVKDMEAMECRLSQLRQKHSSMTKEAQCVLRDLDEVDERQRKCNVIVFGLDETEDDADHCEELFVGLVNEYLRIRVYVGDVVSAYRLRSSSSPRPLFVKLNDAEKKDKVLRASGRLKGTGIGIREDFPREVRQQRMLLGKKLIEERSAGRRASLEFNKLTVEGKVFVCDKLCENVVELCETPQRGKNKTCDSAREDIGVKLVGLKCLSGDWLERHSEMISDRLRALEGSVW